MERTRYDVAAADSYLTFLAAQETIRGAQAGVDRTQVILQTINALVKAELRPGADASRAEAELAAVQTQLIQAQQAAQSARIRGETARYRQIETDLKAQWNAAEARLQGSRRIAANTPVQVNAARAAVDQATARYRSGLGNIDEVAESQRLLTQANRLHSGDEMSRCFYSRSDQCGESSDA